MNTSDYIDDLNRLTYNPDDEVKMTKSAFNTLLRNINTINSNLFKNQEDIAFIKRREDVNKQLAEEMEQILSSLNTASSKKKSKKLTVTDIKLDNITMTEERYQELLTTLPKSSFTPVPDSNIILDKLSTLG